MLERVLNLMPAKPTSLPLYLYTSLPHACEAYLSTSLPLHLMPAKPTPRPLPAQTLDPLRREVER